MSNKFTEFNLPTGAYAAFDASNLKGLIIDRLKQQNVLTDQIYEGSNISSIIDVIAYSYHVLIYYLNRTANESMFSQSEIYENMNRIVKLLNYKPMGTRTSLLPLKMSAKKTLARGIYTIPRYSFIDAAGISYSFNADTTFNKQTDLNEVIETISEETVLYQGKYVEYPAQIATGEPFETFVLTIDSRVTIDHENIDVYVYSNKQKKFVEYEEVSSLYLATPTDTKFEKRFNENQRYEIKFGNGINGVQLEPGDRVHIMYLKTDGIKGKVGVSALAGNQLTLYTSVVFTKIKKDIKLENVNYLNFNDVKHLEFNNDVASSDYTVPETVDQLREFAPQFFRSQNRLVTAEDYRSYLKRNYGNILNDIIVVSNSKYVDDHLRYYDEVLGLTNPSLESRVLYNQVRYADANNTNNVHLYAVPKIVRKTSASPQINFLSPAQKEIIKTGVEQYKMLTDEITFQDPVYMAVSLGLQLPNEEITSSVADDTILVIERTKTAKNNAEEIKSNAYNLIKDYFAHSRASLGQTIDMNIISSGLNNLGEIKRIYMTRRSTPTYVMDGLSLVVWNPVYPTSDIVISNQNVVLPYFKYPYLYDEASLLESIQVTQATR